MVTSVGRVVCAVLAGALLAGCASSSRHRGLNSRFVRPAQNDSSPTAASEAASAPVDSLETAIARIRELSVRARPVAKQVSGATIETLDAQLRAALLAIELWPSADAHRHAAHEYVRLGIRDAAWDHYRAAVRIDPRDGAAYDGLARIWRDWRLPALALGDARRAVYYAPRSAEALNTLGTVLQSLGRRAEAKKAYLQSLQLNPRAAYALNNLGYVAFLERDRAAAEYFRRAIVADSSLLAARRNLALAYAAAGRMDLARHELQQADSPAAAAYNFGIIHLSRQNTTAALAAFDVACRARAGIKWACERYTELSARAPEGTP